VALVAALLSSGGDSASATGTTCGIGKSKTLLRNRVAAVLQEPKTGDGDGTIYSCYFPTGNPISLDSPPDGDFAFHPPALALAGHTLAYAIDTLDKDNNAGTRLWVIDVRKPTDDAQIEGRTIRTHSKVGSVVVRPGGAVAWIDCEGPGLGNGKFRPYCEHAGAVDRVYRWPAGARRPQVLDKGRAIDPSSLRRHGGTISWVRAGKVHRARLRD
jgi:hypothetical protein